MVYTEEYPLPSSRDKNNLTELVFFERSLTAHKLLFYAHINFDEIDPMDNSISQ